MKHNRALVSKTNIQDIRRRCFCKGNEIPTTEDKTLEWLVIVKGIEPSYNSKTEKLENSFMKIDGEYSISYKKVALK